MTLQINTMAPDFKLIDQDGKEHSLSDYRGKPIVLYFYPKDDTPGCTVEACNFRNDFSVYDKAGVVILGVSPDSQKSHSKFREKHNLPFTLLADEGHKVCELFDVWGPKKMMGRSYEGVYRTTYLIGKDGKIIKVFANVKPEGHSAEVLAELN